MSYKLSDITQLYGLRGDRLRQWQRRGWLDKPSISVAKKPGESNEYNFTDLCKIGLFTYLVEQLELTRPRASEILGYVRWDNLDKNPIVYLRGGLGFKGGFSRIVSEADRNDDSFFNLKINVKSLVTFIEQTMSKMGISER
jgi:hypothetical protein